jgi:hypothetical protein
MNADELTRFNQAIVLAQSGQKQLAYTQLKALAQVTGVKDYNLLLWIAFTTPDLEEAETAISMADVAAGSGNPSVISARSWLSQEKNKQVAASTPPRPPMPVAPPSFNAQPTNPLPISNPTIPLLTNNYQPQNPPPPYMPGQPQQPMYQQVNFYQAPVSPQPVGFTFDHIPVTKILQIAPFLGIVLAVIGIFLPWMVVGVFGHEASVNGINGISGSSSLVSAASKNQIDIAHGYLILGMGAVLLIMLIMNFNKPAKFIGLITTLGGLGMGAVLLYDFSNIKQKIDDYNASYQNSVAGVQFGFGLYFTGFAILIIFVSGIIRASRTQNLYVGR